MTRRPQWTEAEIDALDDGLDAGLSWAAIAAMIPTRTERAIRTYAIKSERARNVSGDYPSIIDDGEAELPRGPDPLLARLRATVVTVPAHRPEWLPKALRMRADGFSYQKIAEAVGREIKAVWDAINPDRRKASRKRMSCRSHSPDPQRYWIRRMAREEAAETGEDVESVYIRFGVPTVNRSKLYEQRKASMEARS